jgi:hypothetical protein
MGVWGTGIFQDDDACDIRDKYLDLVAGGRSGQEATRLVVEEWQGLLAAGHVPTFWLALAAVQQQCGRLEDEAKRKALEIIDGGSDLEPWLEDNPQLAGRRRAILHKLKAKLVGPQGPPRKLRKRFRDVGKFKRGDAVSYQLECGRFVLFRILGAYEDTGGVYPWAEICDWIGEEIPSAAAIEGLPFRRWAGLTQWMLIRKKASDYSGPRVCIVAEGLQGLRPAWTNFDGSKVIYWKELDAFLRDCFRYALSASEEGGVR